MVFLPSEKCASVNFSVSILESVLSQFLSLMLGSLSLHIVAAIFGFVLGMSFSAKIQQSSNSQRIEAKLALLSGVLAGLVHFFLNLVLTDALHSSGNHDVAQIFILTAMMHVGLAIAGSNQGLGFYRKFSWYVFQFTN